MTIGILFIAKSQTRQMVEFVIALCRWLYNQKSDLKLFINEKIKDMPEYCTPWNPSFLLCEYHQVDLVVTIGGDGTVLYSSWLFQNSIVPPTMSFNLGSLGFLTDFDIASIKEVMMDWINNPNKFTKTTRMRMIAKVTRFESRTVAPLESQNSNSWLEEKAFIDDGIIGPLHENWIVLNDVVIDRGPSAYMTQLEVLVDGEDCTVVQADGLLIATPTGSTAYSVSAGGSLVHPQVPCILMTPLCPHSLSFRPMILPDSAEVKVVVPIDSRYPAWASFDGKHRIQLGRGDSITIKKSPLNMQTVDPCACPCTSLNWFKKLSNTLHWNVRTRQSGSDMTDEEQLLADLVDKFDI